MKKIIQYMDRIYRNKTIKKYYVLLIGGLTIILFIIFPFFTDRKYILSSFMLDLIVRLFLTFCAWQSAYYVSHLDESYARFYKGANNLSFSKPGFLKKTFNIFLGIAAGYAGYYLYIKALGIFTPVLDKLIFVIALLIGVLIAIPLISQYDKR